MILRVVVFICAFSSSTSSQGDACPSNSCASTPLPTIPRADISNLGMTVRFPCPCSLNATECCDKTVSAHAIYHRTGIAEKRTSDDDVFFLPGDDLGLWEVLIGGLVPYQLYNVTLVWVYPNGTRLDSDVIQERTTEDLIGNLKAPRNVTVDPSNTTLYVQWLPVSPITKPLEGYKVFVNGLNEVPDVETGPNEFSATVTGLLEAATYYVEVAALHEDKRTGDHSAPVRVVMGGTLKTNYFLYAVRRGGIRVVESYITSGEATFVGDTGIVPSADSLVALAVDVYNGRLYAGWLYAGFQTFIFEYPVILIKKFLVNATAVRVVLSGIPEFGQLVVDWMNARLIWAQRETQSSQTYKIVSMDRSDTNSLVTLAASLPSLPSDIIVDPLLGYIYWATGGDGEIFRADLLIGDSPQRLYKASMVTSLSRDGNYLYFVDNGTLKKSPLSNHSATSAISSSVVDFEVADGLLYELRKGSNGRISFVVSSVQSINTVGLKGVPDAENGIEFVTLYAEAQQPLPELIVEPGDFQILFGSTSARVSFTDATYVNSLAGQDGWKPSHYSLTWHIGGISETNSTILNTTAATIYHLTPDTLYHFKLQVHLPSNGMSLGPVARFSGRTLPDDDKTFVVGFSGTDWIFSTLDGMHQLEQPSQNREPINDIAVYVTTSSAFLFVAENTKISYLQADTGGVLITNLSPMNMLLNSSYELLNVETDWRFERLFYSAGDQIRSVEIGSFVRTSDTKSVQVSDQLVRDVGSRVDMLTVGPLTGLLCWSTNGVIGCVELNGINGFVQLTQHLIQAPWTVHALTFADQSLATTGLVYEFVQHHSMVKIIRHNMTTSSSPPTVIYEKGDARSSFVFAYLQNKLLWSNQSNQLEIAELSSVLPIFKSQLPLPSPALTMAVSFDQQALRASLPCHNLSAVTPASQGGIVVIETVAFSDIYIITWHAAQILCGNLPRYKINIVRTSFNGTSVQEEAVISIPSRLLNAAALHPYTKITVEVQAFTRWARSAVESLEFFTHPARPGPPQRLRVFYGCDGTVCNATLRWEPPLPAEQNGKIVSYKVSGRTGGIYQFNVTQPPALSPDVNSYVFTPDVNVVYTLEVAAVVEDAGEGPAVLLNQMFVAGASQAVPVITVVSQADVVAVNVDDTMTSNEMVGFTVKDGLVTQGVYDNSLCWVSESTSPFLLQTVQCIVNGRRVIILERRAILYHGIAYDWISRKLYLSTKELPDSGSDSLLNVYRCDIEPAVDGECSDVIYTAAGSDQKQLSTLLVDATQGRLFKVVTSGGRHTLNTQPVVMSTRKKRQVRSAELCINDMLGATGVALDVPNQQLLIQAENTSDIYGCSSEMLCNCQLVVNASHLLSSVQASRLSDIGLPASSLVADYRFIYWIGLQDNVFYVDRRNPTLLLSLNATGVQGVVSRTVSQQPLPDLRCLGPSAVVPAVGERRNTSIEVTWPSAGLASGCQGVVFDLAMVKYSVRYWVASELAGSSKTKETSNTMLLVDGLEPFTLYNFQLKSENFWNTGMGDFSMVLPIRTAEGRSSAPRNVSMQVTRVPTKIQVSWSVPAEPNGVVQRYEIYDQTTGEMLATSNGNITVHNDVTVRPSTAYAIQVVAVNSFGAGERSIPVAITSYGHPPRPSVTATGESSIEVSLNTTLLSAVSFWSEYELTYRCNRTTGCVDTTCPRGTEMWRSVPLNSTTIAGLQPATEYILTLGLGGYNYYSENSVVFHTTASRPVAPAASDHLEVTETSVLLQWDVSCTNGNPISQFCILSSIGAPFPVYVKVSSANLVKRTATQYRYELTDLRADTTYSVQIAAENSLGRGEPSNTITFTTDSTGSSSSSDNSTTIIAIAVTVPVVILLVLLIILIVCWRRRQTKPRLVSLSYRPAEDMELERLRSTRRNTVPLSFNPTYTRDKSVVDGLPAFPRSQLTLNDFLGQGQFGEVYQGQAHGIKDGEEVTKVAVKTLRKDADERERVDFLTEAKFMSNFQHPNILRLLGVCLDNNPQYVIMELMEGGDLLSFVRAARHETGTPLLTLPEMVKIAVDVCSGGKYLEQLRFVHRDLACRNCLVSSKGLDRVVKIGDFGLARNIYENHYYRKEGEGMLPVRWMAPESLVDGLFTTQADVWSYGVVLWEVFTFGHQPYPARTNQEVLKFVVQGGRLERPDRCPEELFGIMMMCWAHQSHYRPTFRALLERLKVLRSRIDRQSVVFYEGEDEESARGSDSELEEDELAMELDETEREESARAATGEGQVHFGMADATERYVSAATMSRQGSKHSRHGSRHGRSGASRRSLVILPVTDSVNGSVSATPTTPGSSNERGKSTSPFVGKRRAGSARRISSGSSAVSPGISKSQSSGSLRRSKENGASSGRSFSGVEPDRVEIPSTGVVIEFGSASRLI